MAWHTPRNAQGCTVEVLVVITIEVYREAPELPDQETHSSPCPRDGASEWQAEVCIQLGNLWQDRSVTHIAGDVGEQVRVSL